MFKYVALEINFVPLLENGCFKRQTMQVFHTLVIRLGSKEKAHSCNTITWNNSLKYTI